VIPRPGLPAAAFRAAVLGVLAVLTACGSATPGEGDRQEVIRFASYDFQENQILVEVYAEGARRAGLPVSVQHGIGTREVVAPALEQDVVDVVVDYLGTALVFNLPDGAELPGTPEEMADLLEDTMEERGVEVLDHARAEDQNGFAVTTAFAARHGVARLSQLAELAPGLTFGGPPECPDRPLCLPGLRDVYGLQFGEVRTMQSRAATVEALVAGQIDVGLLETTDARLGIAPVTLLIDDKALQPRENVIPLLREEVADEWGDELTEALDETSERLTTTGLVRLNQAVELDGATPAEAAQQWWDGY
jgi:osmoprotectant transport system substrate-binding protein